MQDRLMSEVDDLIDDAEFKRHAREAAEDEAEEFRDRLSRITRPIGESPHEPPRRKRRRT